MEHRGLREPGPAASFDRSNCSRPVGSPIERAYRRDRALGRCRWLRAGRRRSSAAPARDGPDGPLRRGTWPGGWPGHPDAGGFGRMAWVCRDWSGPMGRRAGDSPLAGRAECENRVPRPGHSGDGRAGAVRTRGSTGAAGSPARPGHCQRRCSLGCGSPSRAGHRSRRSPALSLVVLDFGRSIVETGGFRVFRPVAVGGRRLRDRCRYLVSSSAIGAQWV